MRVKSILIVLVSVVVLGILFFSRTHHREELPVIAIANYGRDTSLDDSIQGLQTYLESQGFIEGKTIHYKIADVSFDAALIPQMITELKNASPQVMVVLTTPVAQFAKGAIQDIPLVFNVITDPVKAGLLKKPNHASHNMTGSSDQPDLQLVLNFAKQLLPKAQSVGLLYSTAESNDEALLSMMQKAATETGMKLVAIPVDQSRDVPLRMQAFKGKVDFIYVGMSGPIQPTLPVIAAEAYKMHIPVFNADVDPVKKGLALASYGVSYRQVGANAGRLVVEILRGTAVESLAPLYPKPGDYHAVVSRHNADLLHIVIPSGLQHVELVD